MGGLVLRILARFLGGLEVGIDGDELSLGSIAGGLSITLVPDSVVSVGEGGSLIESQAGGNSLGVSVGLTSSLHVGFGLLLLIAGIRSILFGHSLLALFSMGIGSSLNLTLGSVSLGVPRAIEINSGLCSTLFSGIASIDGRLEVGLSCS